LPSFNPPRTDLPALTGVRALACLWVFLSHAIPGYRPAPNPTLLALTAPGYLGVDVFFVLSGFILAIVYADLAPSAGAVGRFLTRRLFRIYPLNVALMIGIALNAWAHGRLNTGWFDLHYFVPYLLMIETLLPGRPYIGWLPTNWSVGIEILLYLAFPLAALTLRRAPGAALWAALAGFAIAECLTQHFIQYSWLIRVHGASALLRGAAAFFLGAVIATLWRRRPAPSRLIVACMEVLPFAAAAVCLLQNQLWPVPVLAAISITALAWQSGPLAHLLSTRLAVWLGDISYSIYLVHGLILGDWSGIWLASSRAALPEPYATIVWSVLISSTTLAASAITYYAIERPARAFGSRLVTTRRTAVVA
jgi:peptidoglycan/LPS O-acetylase OafA/YrhL